ncbi:MAG: NAD-dependent malic enzyme [Gammaproteobacteria bacterium]|nr:NAD-dependent malic enzyme [Gammaproteobacteria bacterium]
MSEADLQSPWPSQAEPVHVTKSGRELIRDPLLNKGTGFRADERERFRLHGLLPSRQISMDLQVRRNVASIDRASSPLDMYLKLSALQDRNEHLYFRVLTEHLERYMPVIYTPPVAEATRNFSQVFRRARGVWLTPDFRGRMARVLNDAAGDEPVRLIVATDNESILGIGDQGAGGMAICIGKLALYTVAAGIPPAATLPISLDVGTDNKALLDDGMYVGWREPRLRGSEYDEFIEEFVEAVATVFPKALLQWEDLRKDIALRVADRYRARLPSFNDDIQGTGAVALAGVLSSARVTGTRISEQRIVVHGAGAAGLGIIRQLKAAMRLEGLSEAQCLERVAALDSRGLLVADHDLRDAYKRELAWPADLARQLGLGGNDDRGLEAVVRAFRPTVLIGTSGQRGCFNEDIVRAMAASCERPVVMPFSNPSDLSEAVPADVLRWTDGRALVATGSPFAPVELGGRSVRIGQGNNVLVFPGLGLGVLLGGIRTVTDEMLTAASFTLAGKVTNAELSSGMLFPAVSRLREVSAVVAAAVIAVSRGAPVTAPPDAVLVEAVQRKMWVPRYEEYVAVASDAAE